MISVFNKSPMLTDESYAEYVCVGTTWKNYKALTEGRYWVDLMDARTTCLKKTDVTWVTFDGINLGLCRMPKDHEGACADLVRVCDGCDTVYREEDHVAWSSNEDVQICDRCPPY